MFSFYSSFPQARSLFKECLELHHSTLVKLHEIRPTGVVRETRLGDVFLQSGGIAIEVKTDLVAPVEAGAKICK